MQNLTRLVQSKIRDLPNGTPFAAGDFASLGGRAAIAQALKRLTDRGEITRLRRGLYVRPRLSRFVGEVLPSAHEIVEALAQRRHETIQIGGAEAARKLGLSTQMPVTPTYLTSGRSQTITIGNLPVRLQHASPRKLALAGRPAGEALAALYYLGSSGVDFAAVERIRDRLPPREFEALLRARPLMPAWMSRVFRGVAGRDG